jgi:murein DD-endopeptidase MepM/ murein hydrolase activator NlpD
VGSTGFSTGSHLHFEIRYQQGFVDPCVELEC